MTEEPRSNGSTEKPSGGKSPNSNILFDRNEPDVNTLKKLIEQERWTIEYYDTYPNINIIRPQNQKAEFPRTYVPREHEFNRLANNNGRTTIWGCRLCHRFFNYPSLLFDDLFKNHKMKPDVARIGQHIIKLEVANRELFLILEQCQDSIL